MNTFNWRVYKNGAREVWFDRKLRLWTMRHVDESGSQLAEADYTNLRRLAMNWLKTGHSGLTGSRR